MTLTNDMLGNWQSLGKLNILYSLQYTVYCSVQYIIQYSVDYSVGSYYRVKKGGVPQGFHHLCKLLGCIDTVYYTVQCIAQCTVQCTEQCTVQCIVQCTVQCTEQCTVHCRVYFSVQYRFFGCSGACRVDISETNRGTEIKACLER